MRLILLICFICLTEWCVAQTIAERRTVDLVEVRGDMDRRGTLIGYAYGKSVTIVTSTGEVITFPWNKVRRVTFEGESASPIESEDWWITADTLQVLPGRRFRHQLLFTTGFSQEDQQSFNGFDLGPSLPIYGPGVSYHFLYSTDNFSLGPGAGFEVMNVGRGERLVSLTGLAEYRLGRGRVRPFGRFQAGVNLPIGNDRLDMDSRSVGATYHPSVGLLFGPPFGRWMDLSFDIGYRFSTVHFTALTPNLEVVDREIDYRRFTFGLGARF
ncbi:hypothetical protein [Lewinella sp. IMCC34191]|uniref:hypothetical protein n=1 Tax=Lewinella sp. IMCC34191 TaxID=2259172 RepID=UPI001300A2A2|nr:hypothetical protein [Lewinella sp. IMCC34191]